ncbi:copper resistance protein NlpE N-terminal domain-containing protein [Xanthovirga aplysinae]|uniref:copper resistance protein NlpE N-terminal domain-containing protein n=1 Tax=Xanthovirga aplysinae TaxID=2529853 RepID=UPI001656EAB6|nr:copper resistance protein NlpE N-terminal domain-containing protein [Xanthovirga aplysinae]
MLSLLIVVTSCKSKKKTEEEEAQKEMVSPENMKEGPLVMSNEDVMGVYEGDFPCDDCVLDHYLIQFRVGQIYFLERVYQKSGGGGKEMMYEIGHWSIKDGNKLQLTKGMLAPFEQFEFVDRKTLQALNSEGMMEIPKEENQLVKGFKKMDSTPSFSMDGMYVLVTDDGWFEECKTGHRFPVAKTEANDKLEKMYNRKHKEPSEKLFVKMKGYLKSQPTQENEIINVIVVEQVMSMDKKSGCPQK